MNDENKEIDAFGYFTDIERFFQHKRRSYTALSSPDWALMESWFDKEIPLQQVLAGIERAFQKAPAGGIGSLRYCAREVERRVE